MNRNCYFFLKTQSKRSLSTTNMIQRNDLATKALMKTMDEGGFELKKKPLTLTLIDSSSMLNDDSSMRSAPLKRSRSSLSGSFDMGEFIKASEQVEETIAFPAVEWPSFDDDDDDSSYNIQPSLMSKDEDDDEDDDFFSHRSPRKRQCRGLTRCNRSCNLSSLWKMGSTSQRRGSNGSLS